MSTEPKEVKRTKTEEPDPDLGEEYNEIIKQLRNSAGFEKNKCLNSMTYDMKFRARQILDKKIIDAEYELIKTEYELKRAQVQLVQLKEKKELFTGYDPYPDTR